MIDRLESRGKRCHSRLCAILPIFSLFIGRHIKNRVLLVNKKYRITFLYFLNYLIGDALANIALYEKVVHNCKHVHYARNNTINVIVSNVLKQKFSYLITRIIV